MKGSTIGNALEKPSRIDALNRLNMERISHKRTAPVPLLRDAEAAKSMD
jgi:hypothetical protein